MAQVRHGLRCKNPAAEVGWAKPSPPQWRVSSGVWGVGLVLLIAGLAIGCGGKGDGDVEIGSRFTIVDRQGTGEVYRRYRVTG